MESLNSSRVAQAQTNVSVYGAVEETYKEFVNALNYEFSTKETTFLGSCTPIKDGKSATNTFEFSNFEKELADTLNKESESYVGAECNLTGQRMCLRKLNKLSSSRNPSLREIVLVTNTLNEVQRAMMNDSLKSPINGIPPEDLKVDEVPEIHENMDWEYFTTFGLGDVHISEDRTHLTVESMDWEDF